jgi:hypothetical protein
MFTYTITSSNSMEQSPSREADSRSAQSRNSSPYMESEGLLLCSQEPVTGPCPEPDESSPHPHILFL